MLASGERAVAMRVVLTVFPRRLPRPARISHLRDFVFDEMAAEYLPAMVRLDVGCRELRFALRANREGIPLSRAYDYYWEVNPNQMVPSYRARDTASHSLRMDVQSENSVVLWSHFWGEELSYKYFLEIYGRGDFNGDGFDDLLLYLGERHLLLGTVSRSLLILTRMRPDEVFRVVDVYWSSRSEIFISCLTQRSTFEAEGER